MLPTAANKETENTEQIGTLGLQGAELKAGLRF